MAQPGTRVAAIRNADNDTVYLFGYGTYAGDHPYPGWDADAANPEYRALIAEVIRRADADPVDVTGYYDKAVAAAKMTREEADRIIARGNERHGAEMARPMGERVDDHIRRSALNPKIVLDDNAGVVFGMECWWGPVDSPRLQKLLAGRRVVPVPAPHAPEVWPLPAVEVEDAERLGLVVDGAEG